MIVRSPGVSRKQETACFSLHLTVQERHAVVSVVLIFNDLSFFYNVTLTVRQLLHLVLRQTPGSVPTLEEPLATLDLLAHGAMSAF